jgi:hypothetical protein
MSKMEFKLNTAGVRSLMQSDGMQAILAEKASDAVGRLGEGYDYDTYVGKNRANAMVYADSFKARRDNAKNNSILKAVR